ncbi:MAG TPA: hypothetical protein PLV25_06500 [Opitutales bacterium]|nr:hypothetical protein [Opitutales bacterium]
MHSQLDDNKALKMVVDAASPQAFVGLLLNGQWLARCGLEGHTHESLFRGLRECLAQGHRELEDVRGFIYGMGPGSTLGLRIAGLAVGAWRALPAWKGTQLVGYSSLVYLGLMVAKKLGNEARFPLSLLSEARMGSWFHLRMTSATTWEPIERVEGLQGLDLEGKHIYYWPQAKPWGASSLQDLPADRILRYELDELPQVLAVPGFLQQLDSPNPFELALPEYKTWEGKRHGG